MPKAFTSGREQGTERKQKRNGQQPDKSECSNLKREHVQFPLQADLFFEEKEWKSKTEMYFFEKKQR